MFRKCIQWMLQTTELQLTFSCNGLEAVQAVEQDPHYHAILMNICMPVMDGYEATRRIKKLGFTNPIIYSSGLGTEEALQDAFDTGMSDYLCRPADGKELLSVLVHL